jgi:hypothetical protein
METPRPVLDPESSELSDMSWVVGGICAASLAGKVSRSAVRNTNAPRNRKLWYDFI